MVFVAANSAAINNERMAIALGFLTLLSGVAAFLSCRTCLGWLNRLGIKDLMKNRLYAWFYKWHLYYWWAFGVLVLAHFMVAVIHTGLPQAGDPDAGVHWRILGFGLFSAIAGVGVFFSCRVVPRLMAMAGSSDPFHNRSFKSFFKGHPYYWTSLGLLTAAHFLLAFNHAGIWPGG